MENLLETVSLDSDESNELLFKVKVEGADQAPAKVRLVCEAKDVSYMFEGTCSSAGEDIVQFDVPALKGKLAEGTYPARVEVLIDNRYFVPVRFNMTFKRAVTVVAEAMTVVPKKVATSVTVTAAPIVVKEKIVQVVAPVPQRRSTLRERMAGKKNIEDLDSAAIIREAREFANSHKR